MRFFSHTFGKIALYTVVSASVIGIFLLIVLTQVIVQIPNNELPAQIVSSGELTTDVWGIFDPETGEIIAGSNVGIEYPIASVTKLFTAESVLQSSKKGTTFTIVYSDVITEGRSGKLWYGDQVTPYQLLFPLLIESSNDAAEAIKRELADDYTTAVAGIIQNLGLTHTTIADASGLSAKNISTVEDLSKFYANLRNIYPHIADITQLRTYVTEKTGYINNNPARSFDSFTGGKHGYTTEADRTFVGTFSKADGEREIGIVILHSDNLINDIGVLLGQAG